MMKRLLQLFLLLSPVHLYASDPMEIIELKSRSVDEVIPIIRPLLEPDGKVSGMNNQLIIRAKPEQISEVRKILERIDRPARKLIIYVRHGATYDLDRDGVRADINAKLGRHSNITIGRATRPGSAQIRLRSSSTNSQLDATQHVQALEGRPAFIATGKSVPINETTTTFGSGVVQQQNTVRYRDVTTGFYVTPYLNGDQVTLNVSPHMERQGSIHGTYDITEANTSVRGVIGEWLTIGGIASSENTNRSDILRKSQTSGRNQHSIQLLVQEIR
jgi:type II secretory pathway component GspD/PulD (secretin)